MYLNLFKRWLANLWDGMFPRGLRRSSALPALIIAVLIVLPLVAWAMHRHGKFHVLKANIKGDTDSAVPSGPRPGGAEPIVLKRTPTSTGSVPEFLSATLLPGLGMQLLQITASLPGRGEVALLVAPSVQELADGTTPPRSGWNDRWGAIEAPWSGLVSGALTPVGTSVRTSWRGKAIEAPTDNATRSVSEGGLLSLLGADSTDLTPQAHPTKVVATFKGTDFNGKWFGTNDITVSAALGATTLDLTVTAKNVGINPEPMGLGWHPRFVIPSGNRDAVELRLPGADQLEIADVTKGIPTGRFVPPGSGISRFQGRVWPIGPESVDARLGHLKPVQPDAVPSAEMRDPQSLYGLRMSALSEGMGELRLTSPGGSSYVSMGMQSNLDDPFGKEWTSPDAAIQTLAPGQTAEWKIRLEIFSVANHASSR
jgi:hypothetical protein